MAQQAPVAISIIIPFYNEAANVSEVIQEVRQAQPDAEIVAIDDGSDDATWAQICQHNEVRGFRLCENRGQSAAMVYGLQQARGQYCATMDGDGQNDPRDISRLLEAITNGQGDIAVGRRTNRRDTRSRIYASRVANFVRSRFLSDGVSDTGCSLKVFPRDAVTHLVAFNGQHRFLPAVFLNAGYRLCEVDVNHRPRAAGTSKYTNWERALRGIYDLFGVAWLLNRKIHYPKIETSRD